MSHFLFHNNTASLNDLFYESHASVVKMVAMELGQSDKIPELLEKVLGNKLKVKAPKDPNKPKRGKTGFMFYCDEHRSKLMKKFTDKGEKVKIGDIAKKLGASWKKLSDKQKKPYESKAAKDKERYQTQMAEYNEKNGL